MTGNRAARRAAPQEPHFAARIETLSPQAQTDTRLRLHRAQPLAVAALRRPQLGQRGVRAFTVQMPAADVSGRQDSAPPAACRQMESVGGVVLGSTGGTGSLERGRTLYFDPTRPVIGRFGHSDDAEARIGLADIVLDAGRRRASPYCRHAVRLSGQNRDPRTAGIGEERWRKRARAVARRSR